MKLFFYSAARRLFACFSLAIRVKKTLSCWLYLPAGPFLICDFYFVDSVFEKEVSLSVGSPYLFNLAARVGALAQLKPK